jgi:hypothetical protein
MMNTLEIRMGAMRGSSLDSDATAYINALESDGAGSVSSAHRTLIDRLFRDLKGQSNPGYTTANIWSKLAAFYPMFGGSAARHKWNGKDPRDLDAAYRLTFTGSPTHTSTGINFNGTTQHADSKYVIPGANATNFHIGFCSRTSANGGNNYDMGTSSNGSIGTNSATLYIRRISDAAAFDAGTVATGGRVSGPNAVGVGFCVGSITASNARSIYRNGAAIANSSTNHTPTMPAGAVYFGGINDTAVGGAAYHVAREWCFATIGQGLTAAEVTAYYNAVNAFNTALGR